MAFAVLTEQGAAIVTGSGRAAPRCALLTVVLMMAPVGCSSGTGAGTAAPATTSDSATTSSDTGQPSAPVLPQTPSSAEPQTIPSVAPPPIPITEVSGTMMWPDGEPARNILFEAYPQGVGNGGIGNETPVEGQTNSQGSYAFDGCPCQFSMWLLQPETPGRGPFDGGRDCWIPMAHDNAIDLVPADPGDTLDWTVVDVPCSDTPYNPRDFDSSAQQLTDQQNAYLAGQDTDFSGYAGPWQQARQRAGG
jgi:hypothetical protein